MTGVFELIHRTPADDPMQYPPPEKIPMFEKTLKTVELPLEIYQDIHNWWYKAKHGEEIVIRCELPV